MVNFSWNEIQDRATEFASKWQDVDKISSERGEAQSFWSDFLTIYGIDRRRHGAFFEYAIKKGSGGQGFIDMFWPGKLLAEQKAPGRDLAKANLQAYEYLETMPDHDLPQAIVVSDFTSFECINLETNEKTVFSLVDLPKHVKLFAFLIDEAGKKTAEELPVNRQAAEAMAKLHNQLRDDNYTGHDLELLLVRLVFCMFADDSGIFEHSAVHDYLQNRTSEDGSDLGPRLQQIFQALNTPEAQRQSSLDEAIAGLPYVNGGLFAEDIRTPYFTSQMRRDLLQAMQLDWAQVSPAIFGSMFQGVMDEKERRNLGAHYTSEKNILRVIKPLFLDNLYVEFAKVRRSPKRLAEFHDKLASLKFLDPACGCGNFLVITYRELRRLEHKVVDALNKGNKTMDMFAVGEHGKLKVNVDQMYGIEIEEFPSLIAQTALWLTDHQMNMEFSALSGKTYKRLPLKVSATIVNGNALTTDWAEIVAPSELSYILGNPPFNGARFITKEMRLSFNDQFNDLSKGAGQLDFVSAWYAKATKFMKHNPAIQSALVSTNSITQGEQVPILWKYLCGQGTHINFAHQTFKWANDARGNAAVYCVIIGFALFEKKEKRIFEYADIKGDPNEVVVKNINPYLVNAPTVFIENRSTQISDGPKVNYGSFALDDGNYTLTKAAAEEMISHDVRAKKYIRAFVGGFELINGAERYCLWLKEANPTEIRTIESIRERVERVRQWRGGSKRANTRTLASTPTLFAEIRQPDERYIAFPTVSSERRDYIPIAMLDKDVIASNQVYVVNSSELYTFAILTSRMHMAWVGAVCGRLENRYRYSARLVYNNFIWPGATEAQKAEIEKLAQAALAARAEFPDASLADLYDPLTMPPQLAKAHKALDRAVDKLYQKTPFATDADRVALLFQKYQDLTNA